MKRPHLRIARPTRRLEEISRMYTLGLGFSRLGGFSGHAGIDGVMLGHPDQEFHLEFTQEGKQKEGQNEGNESRQVQLPPPHPDALLVFYEPDETRFEEACARMRDAGFQPVTSHNPYWEDWGETFADLEGHRVTWCRRGWAPQN